VITAQVAAEILGISTRMLYDLAAPKGPIPCVRYSAKCVRFDPEDIKAYAESCKCAPRDPVKIAGPTYFANQRLRAKSEESELVKLFRKGGITPKTRPKINQ
jgi:predicted DNA-binding transcriptional regulator AlpA